MSVQYDDDVVAWASEQAALLRAGKLDGLDLEHLAEEIEDVGKTEQRELSSRLVVLLAHLLKWQRQPTHRGTSWRRTIEVQRDDVLEVLEESPSLRPKLVDPAFAARVWRRAVAQAATETGLDAFPESCPWAIDQVLASDYYPER